MLWFKNMTNVVENCGEVTFYNDDPRMENTISYNPTFSFVFRRGYVTVFLFSSITFVPVFL